MRSDMGNVEAICHAQRFPMVAMTAKSLGLFPRGLVIILVAASGLVCAPMSHAEPATLKQAGEARHMNGQPDVDAMTDQARKLRTEGNYVKAAELWRQILEIAETAFGRDHPNVATSLNNLAGLLRRQGRYTEAEPLYRRALAINENALGPDHPEVATILNNLAELLKDKGQHTVAEPLFRRSLAIFEKALGRDHPSVAASLNNLAGLLEEQGKYAAAKPLYRRALAINEKTIGPDHPHFAASLSNLAVLLNSQGQAAEAEPIMRRSLAIFEKALGPDHDDVATSLDFLAVLLRNQGKYAAVEPLLRRSLAIREKAFGQDHPEVAISYSSLAGLLNDKGQYNAAEPLYRRSLAIREKVFGQDHPDVATSIGNLAELLMRQGQSAAAEPLYRRSLAIREKALGRDHPDVATSIGNLAELLMRQGQYTAAEPLSRRSLAIREKALGPDHPSFASSLNDLAVILEEQGKYAGAEQLYRRSLAIVERSLGANHPFAATSLNNLAMLLYEQGQYAAAEPLYLRSLAIQEKAHGSKHLDVATSLRHLAALFMSEGRKDKAISFMNRSLAIQSTWLRRELPLLPDQSRSAQLRQLSRAWEWVFGWIERHPPATQLALETRLNRHGLLSEIEQRQALLLNASGVDRGMVEQLHALTQQLASVSLPADRRTMVREQRDKLQAKIYRQIPDLQLQLVSIEAVAKALPADGVLVEFQRYQPYDGRKPTDQRWDAAQYIALVLKPNGSVNAVPLGPAAAIDATVHKVLRATADGLSDADVTWSQLSNQVLKPLLPQLTRSRQWFLSPDGELNRVPFAALPAPQQMGTPLAQAVQLRLITTGRELVRLQQPALIGSEVLVMANPNYDRLSSKLPPVARPDAVATVAQRRSAELGSNQWKPLPASEREGQKVAKLLGTGLITGAAATTTALQRRIGPRVLHVATHGFFVADQEAKSPEGLKAIQEGSPLLSSLRQEDPQLRSGLVFAGANQPDLDPNDDGYLTAAEAVNLNLKGTELVVLSACSTGQGEVRTGEGVYGLQRSLTVAGARSTLLSLWKVDDAATAEFMGRYYQRLKSGEGRSDALAAVQEEFRSGKVQSPSGANWTEPYYWAAWQLVGDWRPIKGL